jgi:hypothetical protein
VPVFLNQSLDGFFPQESIHAGQFPELFHLHLIFHSFLKANPRFGSPEVSYRQFLA